MTSLPAGLHVHLRTGMMKTANHRGVSTKLWQCGDLRTAALLDWHPFRKLGIQIFRPFTQTKAQPDLFHQPLFSAAPSILFARVCSAQAPHCQRGRLSLAEEYSEQCQARSSCFCISADIGTREEACARRTRTINEADLYRI